ncbi:MAG: leucyl-tRNA synthetase, partial [Bacteroidia bacterium]
NVQEESFDAKAGKCINSDFLNGLEVPKAVQSAIDYIKAKNLGEAQINYKLRDAGFGRQRYWGEPIPVVFDEEQIPSLIPDSELPLTLPKVESYKPTGTGASPLASIEDWVNTPNGRRETDTMPGWAGSSWYFLRYMDPKNDQTMASKEAIKYWGQVDFYLGGAEHATGHLLYSRFWTKFLSDINVLPFDEPFKKLVNQGMIQGTVESLYLRKEKIEGQSHFVSSNAVKDHDAFTQIPLHVDFVMDYKKTDSPSYLNLDGIKQFMEWRPEYDNAVFECSNGILKDGMFEGKKGAIEPIFYTKSEIGKMSKRWFNVVNPDDICEEYGADTLRMYEMFLGPLEDAKPWNISGIDGVYRFLKKTWKLFVDKDGNYIPNDVDPDKKSLKTLHATIKKVSEDIPRISFNTCISTFMIAVNEFTEQKCTSKSVLDEFLTVLSPFAPHIAEELWEMGGHKESIALTNWPVFNAKYLIEDNKNYPISINGKTRTNIELSLSLSKDEIEAAVLDNEEVKKWLEGKPPRKVIVVPGRIVNLVV